MIQGVANSEASEERFVVIGAAPDEKRFYAVANTANFDAARVSPILAKYLDPLPNLELFNNLQTDDGLPLVVLIFSAVQPRPIMVKTEGQKVDGKTRLQVGDIWIKKGTALQRASRSDLDLMYRQRMEEEAEDRARKRFKHFNDISPQPQNVVSFPTRMPARELLVGPPAEFRRFVEELMAGNDKARFLMLIELVRESVVEGWLNRDIAQAGFPQDLKEYAAELNDFFRDEFLTSIQSLVSLSHLIIKNDFQPEWLQSAIDVLLEGFEESRNLQRLKSSNLAHLTGTLQWWRPAFEIYVALKSIAIYAVMRNRPRFLAYILQRLFFPLSIDNRPLLKKPVLYWPLAPDMFSGNELLQGRSTFLWKERISASWGDTFGSYDRFLGASCQLELLLEFNSHLGTNSIKDVQLQRWLEVNAQDDDLTYVPDLYAYTLEVTKPMAERLYDVVLAHGSSGSSWEILPDLFTVALKNKTRDQRVILYGEFLDGLKTWQSRTMMQYQRFPFMFTWQGRLADAVEKYRAQRPPKK